MTRGKVRFPSLLRSAEGKERQRKRQTIGRFIFEERGSSEFKLDRQQHEKEGDIQLLFRNVDS